ncbi:hypothetical protein GO986_11915 [Deinococcus sp. HMF7620]|uniref:Uncharacterized protein n=1 Tax=Deinococcus arboris TaxID=2682977 RepID=A0A7C9HS26_9DEIO|nr:MULTISPECIES: hypothetical protein [Deinococcus]MBZ9752174.1 hypothetical protein [Deinococcus betulae]MVN87474.1 hypothetical protein [Deinococcus arboris]
MTSRTTITEEQLYSPEAWNAWRRQEALDGFTHLQSAEYVLAYDSDIAHLRASLVLYYAEQLPDGLPSLRRCLKSKDVSIRACAMAILVHNEWGARSHVVDVKVDRFHPAIDSLNEQLKLVRESDNRSDFSLEVEVWILYGLANLFYGLKVYHNAVKYAAEAIYLSIPLSIPALTLSARMLYGLASTMMGNIKQALNEYQSVLDEPTRNNRQALLSSLNMCTIYFMQGNFKKALAMGESVCEEYPTSIQATLTLQNIRAMCGMLVEDDFVKGPYPELEITHGALLRLSECVRNNKTEEIGDILSSLSGVVTTDEHNEATVSWIRAYILLKTGKSYLAAQRLYKDPAFPLLSILTSCLKLEICLDGNGFEIESTAQLCSEIRSAFEKLPTRDDRMGMAELISFWHPLAAAFIAVCPQTISELMDVALPAIFTDDKPITVHGRGVSTRVPFVQITLESFGIDATVSRNQHTEQMRLRSALLSDWGKTQRILPVIAPAVIIFHLLRVSEEQGAMWRMAALNLAKSNGVIPRTTTGENLRAERLVLAKMLDDYLARRLTSQGFKDQLEDVKMGKLTA